MSLWLPTSDKEIPSCGFCRDPPLCSKELRLLLSASDGNSFTYEFKQAKIGTLIGKGSWGGVIGIRGSLPFLDGGYMYKPEFSSFGTNGKWVIEGHGVDPDIVVDNDPALEYKGIDQQLNKAIEEVLKQMETNKKPQIPKVPPFPNKSK